MTGPRGRVSALVSELETWKAQSAGMREESEAPAGLLRRRAVMLGAALLAVAGGAGLWLVLRPAPAPVAVLRELNGFAVADADGHVLWRKALPAAASPEVYREFETTGRRSAWIGDLRGERSPQVLVVLRAPPNVEQQGVLVCYSAQGRELWRFTPGRPVRTRSAEYSPVFNIHTVAVSPPGKDGGRRIAVAAFHNPYWPAQVAVLSAEGKLLGEYWHAGHLHQAEFADLDRDGRPELYVGGVSNSQRCATLIALDPENLRGASKEENPDYQLLDLPPAQERARLLFPRTPVSLRYADFCGAQILVPEPEGLRVHVREPVHDSIVVYYLDRQLHLRRLDPASGTVVLHQMKGRSRGRWTARRWPSWRRFDTCASPKFQAGS